MAARRLIMAMIGLLAISVLIAVFVQGPADTADQADTAATGATSATGSSAENQSGTETGTIDDAIAGGVGRPGRRDGIEWSSDSSTVAITQTVGDGFIKIRAKPDSRLILALKTGPTVDLSIPDFGRTTTATRYAPAVFDLLLPKESGTFVVERLDTGRRLALINTNCRPGEASVATGPSQGE